MDKIKLATITRVTQDKEYKEVRMEDLKKDDLFIMENDSGELTSVDKDGQFILKAIADAEIPIYKNVNSIKCGYYA